MSLTAAQEKEFLKDVYGTVPDVVTVFLNHPRCGSGPDSISLIGI